MENYKGLLIGILALIVFRYTVGSFLRRKIKERKEEKKKKDH
ncbi:hypothetical protein U8527_01815 [Kordia algicida OT-1]|uniref:Uncharacterized protein n=1 Tax=Kordia algicida OT-1 TaxID=391587 RepID=A9DT87_9FLAO|nr:hypothetical protein [Kordia algicida]EDP97039.1 hypothetical protein KAOT1_17788 [Kordia algicida OT-1]